MDRDMTTIAFVSSMNSLPWGGSEVLWYEAAELLSKQGHTVTLCTPPWPKLAAPLAKAKAEWGAQHYFDPSIQPRHLLLRMARRFRPRSAESSKRRWLRQVRPVLLCLSNGNAFQGLEWMEAAMAEKIPFVTIAQAHADFLSPTDSKADRLIKAFSAAKANYFVARANQELVEAQLGVRLTNARLIGNHSQHLSVSSPIFWPQQPDQTLKLACVARLHPASKGQDLLFQALAGNRWSKRAWQLSLYGAGEQEQCLRRLAQMLGISQRVHFMGHSVEPMEIWKTHHALVLASRYEGIPLVLMEAMLAGRPVISTAVAGMPELVKHGLNGFLAEAPTVQHLQQCLEEAWARRSQWPDIGRAAHAAASERAKEVPAFKLARELLLLAKR
jgi:glycosyltransferase involved in cell wall biosynthesis